MPARPAAHLAGRAAADGGPAGGRGRRLRGRHQPARAALGQRPANGRRRRSTPTCGPAGPRRSPTASSSRPATRSRSVTHRSARPSHATCCRSPGRAITRRWPAASMGPPPPSPGTGCRPTTRSVPGARRSRPPPSPGSRHAAADELSALELALALVASSGGSGPARRRAAPALDRVDLQVRASEAAFAVGQTSRATAFLEAAIGGLDARRDRVRLGLLHERLAQIRRAAGDPAGAMHAARRAVELVPREPSPERATVLAGLAQLKMLDGIFSESAAPRPRSDQGRPCLRAGGACPGDPRHDDAGRRARPGAAIRPASIDLLREAERAASRAGRPGRAVPDPGQPDDRPRPASAAGPRPSRSPTRRIEDARRSGLEAVYGNFLAGERGRHAVPARAAGPRRAPSASAR